MQVQLPQLDEDNFAQLQDELKEIKEFKDQIYLQIKTTTAIAQKDLRESEAQP